MQATRRPFSAPLRPSSSIRPKSAKTPKLQSIEDHCARLRQLSSLAKTPTADKETFLAVVDALEHVDASRKDADASSRALSEEMEELRDTNQRLHEQVAEMAERLRMYEKLHVIAEVVNKSELEASLREINAAIQRYSGSMKGGAEDHEVTILPPTELEKRPASSTSRPSSPSVIAKQSELAELLRRNREEREETFNETTRSGLSSPVVMEGIDTMILLEDKLKALEKLVFVLKKRVILYESNEELFNLMNKYSSVHSLLDKTTKINQENEKFRLRELRFQSDPLLRWRVCAEEKSSEVVPSILLALQNELAAYKSIVDKHALEDTNKSDGSSDTEAEFVHINEILRDNMHIVGDEEESLPVKIDFLHPTSEDEMIRKLNALELTNTNLLKKIDRMKEERKVQLEYLEVKEGLRVLEEEAHDVKTEEERLLNKEKKIAKLTRLNDSLMKQIGKWETALQSKSDAVDDLNEVVANFSAQKKELEDVTIQLRKRCNKLTDDLQKSRSQLNIQSARLRSLIDLSAALALSVLPLDSIPEENRNIYVGFLYREWMRAANLMLMSTVKLQKCVRGHLGRRHFKRRNVGELPTPWHIAVTLRRRGSPTPSGNASAGAGAGEKNRSILEYVRPLCRILGTLPEGIRTCATTHQLLKISSLQVKSKLGDTIRQELGDFSNFMAEAASSTNKAIEHVLANRKDASEQSGVPLSQVPHLIPEAHIERRSGVWVGRWAQPPLHVRKNVPSQIALQTPSDKEWAEMDQLVWTRPGFSR